MGAGESWSRQTSAPIQEAWRAVRLASRRTHSGKQADGQADGCTHQGGAVRGAVSVCQLQSPGRASARPTGRQASQSNGQSVNQSAGQGQSVFASPRLSFCAANGEANERKDQSVYQSVSQSTWQSLSQWGSQCCELHALLLRGQWEENPVSTVYQSVTGLSVRQSVATSVRAATSGPCLLHDVHRVVRQGGRH